MTLSVCGDAVEMVQSDVVCVCCVDFHHSSLVSRFICSQWFNYVLFEKNVICSMFKEMHLHVQPV